MRLILHQDRPGELAEPGAADRLDKAIRELQHQVRRSTLPKLPGDGEVKALAELREHVGALYAARMADLAKAVTKAATDAAKGR